MLVDLDLAAMAQIFWIIGLLFISGMIYHITEFHYYGEKGQNKQEEEEEKDAEEVEEVFPELVSKDDSGKAAAMSYGRMTAVLLEAIKELKEEVDELKQENIYMKQMNRKNK